MNAERDDRDSLLDISTSISDGAPVEWSMLEASDEDGTDPALLRELRLIARIAEVHRGAATDDSAPQSVAERHWGDLVIKEELGRGSFGVVYRAHDPRLDRDVALKIYKTPARPDTSLTSLFAEGRLLARVRHQNVVMVHGVEQRGEEIGLWLELIDGRSLADEVRSGGPLGFREAALIGQDVCRALAAVHQAGMIHRDVKAQNVMRERGGRIVLMDFGIGRDLDAPARTDTDSGGTPLYMAPELFEGADPSIATDLYSLGVLLFFLVTGSHPVQAASRAELERSHRAGRRLLMRDVRADVPDVFVDVIERACAAEPAERYATAGAMQVALTKAIGLSLEHRATSEPGIAHGSDADLARLPQEDAAMESASITDRDGRMGAARRFGRAERWRRAGIALAVLALIGGGVWASWRVIGSTSVDRSLGSPAFQPREWVLVTAFDNRTGLHQFDRTLEHALEHELSNSAYVNVAARHRVEDALRLMARPITTTLNETVGREVALRDGGIRLVIAGGVDRVGDIYAITVRVVDPREGIVIASRREETRNDSELPHAVRRLSNWIRTSLGESPLRVGKTGMRLEKATTPSLRALRLYSEGFAAFKRAAGSGGLAAFAEAEALLGAALAEDPAFASAHIWTAWAQLNAGKDSHEYLRTAERAVELAGGTTERERYFILGSHYLMTQQTERAIGAFEALLRLYPDDYWGLHKLNEIYRAGGREKEADEILMRAAAGRPNDFEIATMTASQLLWSRGLEIARPYIGSAQTLLNALPSATDRIIPPRFAGPGRFVRRFTSHDLWVQRRVHEAITALDTTDAQWVHDAKDDRALAQRAFFQLTFGQLRLAQETAAGIQRDDVRTLTLATIAFARNDRRGIITQLEGFTGVDPLAIVLLAHAGDLTKAERLFASDAFANNPDREVIGAEMEAARGYGWRVRDTLQSAVAGMHRAGARRYLHSETLARELGEAGDKSGAITVLEDARAGIDATYNYAAHTGYFWLRTQKQLADRYREAGLIEKARAIEADLRAALGSADSDHPMVVELKKRKD